MPALKQNIVVNEAHMNQISNELNKCANYVEDIIVETNNMKNIMEDSYHGRASTGLYDYFSVLNQHLDLLNLCYKQLASYTDMVKDLCMSTDKSIASLYIQNTKQEK